MTWPRPYAHFLCSTCGVNCGSSVGLKGSGDGSIFCKFQSKCYISWEKHQHQRWFVPVTHTNSLQSNWREDSLKWRRLVKWVIWGVQRSTGGTRRPETPNRPRPDRHTETTATHFSIKTIRRWKDFKKCQTSLWCRVLYFSASKTEPVQELKNISHNLISMGKPTFLCWSYDVLFTQPVHGGTVVPRYEGIHVITFGYFILGSFITCLYYLIHVSISCAPF